MKQKTNAEKRSFLLLFAICLQANAICSLYSRDIFALCANVIGYKSHVFAYCLWQVCENISLAESKYRSRKGISQILQGIYIAAYYPLRITR